MENWAQVLKYGFLLFLVLMQFLGLSLDFFFLDGRVEVSAEGFSVFARLRYVDMYSKPFPLH